MNEYMEGEDHNLERYETMESCLEIPPLYLHPDESLDQSEEMLMCCTCLPWWQRFGESMTGFR